MHGRTSAARSARVLATRCGSAIWPRTMLTRSAWPAASTASAAAGVRMWLSAWTTARETTFLSAAANGAPRLLLVQRDRDDRVEVEVSAGPARHVVHRAPRIVPGDDLGQLGHRQRLLGPRIHADREPDDEVVAGDAADPLEHGHGEPHPSFERAAPAIGPPVRPWRPELVDERVVGGEDLDSVEAGRPGPTGGRRRSRR